MWRVKYEVAAGFVASPEAKEQSKAMGLHPDDPNYASRVLAGAQEFGQKAVELAHKDMEIAADVYARESIGDEELMSLCPWWLNSYVVKLKSGSLLLYAPVKIRDETGFAEWVDGLGRLES